MTENQEALVKRCLVGNSQLTALVFRELRHKHAHLSPSSPEHGLVHQ